MILLFSDWVLSKSQGGLLGYQYDNLTRELVVQGDLPEGWTWDMLVSASGKGDTWPLALGDGQASITLTDDNLSVRGEYYLQLRGTNGDQVRHTNVVTAYNSRSLSGAGQWPTLPTEWIQAEKDIKELNAHPPVPGSNGYWLLWDLSSHSYQESDLPVPVGPAGPPNVLEIGTVETLPADQQATASITGESPAQKLNLGIPQGKQGATGNPGAPGKDGQNGVTPTLAAGNVETLEPGQPATASVTGDGPEYQINLGIPQGPPGQDGVQLNDNAVNATEAWSSKKIVDTLCPPFTVTGNPVTCHPVEGYPLSAVVTLKPKQAGSGDPSLENVRPITGYDEFTVTRCGKNLVDIPKIDQSTPGENEGVSVFVVLPASITISANYSSVEITRPIWRFKIDFLDGSSTHATDDQLNGIKSSHVTVNGTQENPITSITYRNTYITSGEISNIMFNIGSTPEPYVPYQGNDYTLTLPETIYGGTVDAATGLGSAQYIYRELAISDMDNSENFPGWKNVPWINDVKHKPAPDGEFATLGIYGVTNIADISQGAFWNSHGTQVYTLPEYWGGKTQSQIKEAYPDLVMQFCLQLVTPTPFQATGNQALPAMAGLNTVYTDGDSLDVTGRQDLLYTLQNMQAQTTNLNRFIAEGGTR